MGNEQLEYVRLACTRGCMNDHTPIVRVLEDNEPESFKKQMVMS